MSWSQRAAAEGRARAGERLQQLATQWRPGELPGRADPGSVGVRAGVRWSGWGRPALRGLAVVAAALLVIVAYGLWMGRPRAVAEIPVPTATGSPWPGAVGSALPSPEPTQDSGGPDTGIVPPGPAPTSADGPGEPSPAPSPAEVVVHVIGQVAHPGLVRVSAGSRVADAIDAAGGVTRPRAADSVNLARPVADGEQIVVGGPSAGIVTPASTSVTAGSGPATGVGPTARPMLVDLNAADVAVLDTLPGVGPVLAGRIVAWRAAHGPFRSIDELGEVSGIGDAILAQLRDLVHV